MADIEISAVNVDESIGSGFGGEFTFTITLTEQVNDSVTVEYRTISGTALEDVDYPDQTGTVVFAPNQTTATVTFRASSDSVDEPDEALVLELFDPVRANFANDQKVLRQTAWIQDDDGVGNDLSLFVSSPIIVEGNNGTREAIFDVSLSRASGSTQNFDYSTVDGTAVAGEDYTAKSGTLSFAPGQTSQEVRVTISGDQDIEPSEFFNLVIEPTGALADGGIGAAGTATILDDDAGGGLPTVSVEGISAEEGIGSGFGGPSQFLVTLSAPSLDEVTVEYRALPGSALESIDYSQSYGDVRRGTVTFAPGETSKRVLLPANDDSVDEDDEAFVLELFDPGNAVLAGGAKVLRETVFIIDDDSVGNDLALFVSSPVVVEGDSGTASVTFDIELSRPPASTLVFDYSTKDGSASDPSDYVGGSGQVSFAPGETHKTVTVTVKGDKAVEGTEFFSLVVEPTNALGDGGISAAGVATILDDDAGGNRPTISVEGIDATESIGSGFGGPTQFIVTLSEASTDEVTVAYRTAPGTATDSVDYKGSYGDPKTGTVTFAPGETSKLLIIPAASDSTDEADEAFVLELTDPKNAKLAGGVDTLREAVFILDDDGTGSNLSYFVTDVDVTEGNSGTRKAVFEVELSRPTTSTISLDYATQNGSASAGSDYVAQTGTLVFDPGQTRASVSVEVIGDLSGEGTEDFNLIFTNRPGGLASAFPGVVGTASILDDEIVGTGGPDMLTGGAGRQAIYGKGGADVLKGKGGADLLFGGAGSDLLLGGAGRDKISGGAGNDTASYAAASKGVTVSLSKTGFQTTGEGDDQLVSIENLAGSSKGDTLTGDGAGNVLTGLAGADSLSGLGGNDTLFGNGGNDRISGGNGTDKAEGGGGKDVLLGNGGADVLRGQGGDDVARGGDGNDRLFGGNGKDRLEGNGGGDVLDGDAGADKLFGGGGNDRLQGDGGNDVLFGGTGADVFVFARSDGTDRIRDFGTGKDRIELDGDLWPGPLNRAAVIDRFAEDRGDDVALDFGNRGTLIVENVESPDDLLSLLVIV